MNHMTKNERSTHPCLACRSFPNPSPPLLMAAHNSHNPPLLTAAQNSRAVFTGPWRFVKAHRLIRVGQNFAVQKGSLVRPSGVERWTQIGLIHPLTNFLDVCQFG